MKSSCVGVHIKEFSPTFPHVDLHSLGSLAIQGNVGRLIRDPHLTTDPSQRTPQSSIIPIPKHKLLIAFIDQQCSTHSYDHSTLIFLISFSVKIMTLRRSSFGAQGIRSRRPLPWNSRRSGMGCGVVSGCSCLFFPPLHGRSKRSFRIRNAR